MCEHGMFFLAWLFLPIFTSQTVHKDALLEELFLPLVQTRRLQRQLSLAECFKQCRVQATARSKQTRLFLVRAKVELTLCCVFVLVGVVVWGLLGV